MNILILSTHFGMPTVPDWGYGGMEKVNWFLSRELAWMGHRVTLVGVEGSVPPEDVELMLYQHHPAGESDLEGTARMIDAQDRWDIIHDSSHFHRIAKMVRRRERCICTMHNPNPRDGAPNMVVLSHYHSTLHDYGPVKVVYNGVPGDFYPYYPEKGDFIGSISVIAEHKGVYEVVLAAHEAGLKLRLASHTPDGDYFRRIMPYLGDRIVYIGEIKGEEKRALMGQAAAIVLYAKWPEPGSLIGPETMAFGTPLIGSDAGCVPEYIEHGVTGFVCNVKGGVDALVRAMLQVREISPEACYRRWQERFTAERMARDYLELYERTIAGEQW